MGMCSCGWEHVWLSLAEARAMCGGEWMGCGRQLSEGRGALLPLVTCSKLHTLARWEAPPPSLASILSLPALKDQGARSQPPPPLLLLQGS